MDCRGDELIQHNNRTSAQAVPFQYLINEQAKSILALQELQNEVGALLEFRDLVMDTFPHLRHKQVSSSPEPSSGSQGVGENRWEPGVRVRRKLGSSSSSSSSGWVAGGGGAAAAAAAAAAATNAAPRSRSYSHGKGPKSGEPGAGGLSVGTVQDSGFCTESKDSSSTSSRTTMTKNGCCKDDGGDDELWSLLEVIQDKGTRLKLEVEFLQSRLLDDGRPRRFRWRQRFRRCRSLEAVQLHEDCERLSSYDGGKRPSAVASATDDYYCDYNVFRAHVTDLKRERDALLDRVTEMEAESLSNAAQIHRLLAELRSVVCENRELEERLCGGKTSAATVTADVICCSRKSSSHNDGGGGGGGFVPVQHEPPSTGPSSSSAGRGDVYYTPSQHSACNLSSIELCKPCSSSYCTDTDDDGRHRSRMLLARPSDPISRNLEGRAASPPPPPPPPSQPAAVDIGSPTFAKRLGALDGIVSSPADRIGKAGATPLNKRTLAAILSTFNPIELQRHLITVSYENKNLVHQVELLNKSKNDVSNELNRSKEDNEELKFQLEEKRIELEGTMARVRLLQLHQEQQQHGPVDAVTVATAHQQQSSKGGGTAATAATTNNQWLDLVPSNPILPQIALPGIASSTSPQQQHHHHLHNGHHLHQHHNNNSHQHHQDENGGGGSSSTESAHQARSGKPSKIPVVKSSYSVPAVKPPSSYREHGHHAPRDSYPSWNKCKSDQSLPRNWDSINKGGGGGGGSSSISSGGKQYHHRARRDSGSGGGGTSLTRAKSQNGHYHLHHHHQRATVNSTKDHRTAGTGNGGGGGITTVTPVIGAAATAAASSSSTDDINKVRPTKRFANILNSWMRKS